MISLNVELHSGLLEGLTGLLGLASSVEQASASLPDGIVTRSGTQLQVQKFVCQNSAVSCKRIGDKKCSALESSKHVTQESSAAYNAHDVMSSNRKKYLVQLRAFKLMAFPAC